MNLKTNVIKENYHFSVTLPNGDKKIVIQKAESLEAARLLMKSREAAGEFALIEDGDGS